MPKLISYNNLLPGIIEDIDIFKIRSPRKLLRSPDSGVKELADSISQKGLLQPILVRTREDYFEIVAGNRRYQACRDLQYKKISCLVVELGDREAFEISLIENVQRKRLSPIEEANAFKSYISDFGWGGMVNLAIKIGKSASYVTKRIKLLNLPSEVLTSINDSTIKVSVAEELCSIKDQSTRSELSKLISKRHLSLRKARQLLKDIDDGYAVFNCSSLYTNYQGDLHAQRSFDKTIIALRIAMNRIGEIIEDVKENWVIYEIILHHRSVVHQEIDFLLKEKKKLKCARRVQRLSSPSLKSFGAERFCDTLAEV